MVKWLKSFDQQVALVAKQWWNATDGADDSRQPLPGGPAEDVEATIVVDGGRGRQAAALLVGEGGLRKNFLKSNFLGSDTSCRRAFGNDNSSGRAEDLGFWGTGFISRWEPELFIFLHAAA